MAMKHGETAKMTPFLYLMIVIGLVFDVAFMNYEYSALEILGCIIIFVSILTPPIKLALTKL